MPAPSDDDTAQSLPPAADLPDQNLDLSSTRSFILLSMQTLNAISRCRINPTSFILELILHGEYTAAALLTSRNAAPVPGLEYLPSLRQVALGFLANPLTTFASRALSRPAGENVVYGRADPVSIVAAMILNGDLNENLENNIFSFGAVVCATHAVRAIVCVIEFQ